MKTYPNDIAIKFPKQAEITSQQSVDILAQTRQVTASESMRNNLPENIVKTYSQYASCDDGTAIPNDHFRDSLTRCRDLSPSKKGSSIRINVSCF
jgi:hypothetical protein